MKTLNRMQQCRTIVFFERFRAGNIDIPYPIHEVRLRQTGGQ